MILLQFSHQLRKADKKCRGMGTLVFMVLIVIAVMVIFVFMQHFSTVVTRQRENIASGKKAFYLAEAAINEALLDFNSKVNVPSEDPSSWFHLAREKLTASYDRLARKTFTPQLTQHLYDDNDIKVEAVDVAMWSQFSINKLQYEKVGLLTFTAVVMIPRRLPGLWGKYVRRNVQKSYEFRHVLLTPPRPFDGFTLFLDSWPYLQKTKDEYSNAQEQFAVGSQKLEKMINRSMESHKEQIAKVVDWAKNRVDEYEKARDAINGLSSFELLKIGKSRSELYDKLDEEDEKIARDKGFKDAATVKIAAATNPACWMDGIHPWQAQQVRWPSFRKDKALLTNPVYVVEKRLQASQMVLQWPPSPETPQPYPSASLPKGFKEIAAQADWNGELSNFKEAFSNWCNERDATISPFDRAIESELQRHEALFKLVPNEWVDTFRKQYEVKATPDFWKAKASYVFENQAQFDRHLRRKGETVFLDGVYFVEGALKLNFPQYVGSGAIVSKATIDIGDCHNAGDGCLTLAAEKEIFMNGNPQAGLLAPKRCIKFRGGSLSGVASAGFHSGDDFSISYDESMTSKLQGGGDRLPRFWVTVSPYHIACNFLRN